MTTPPLGGKSLGILILFVLVFVLLVVSVLVFVLVFVMVFELVFVRYLYWLHFYSHSCQIA